MVENSQYMIMYLVKYRHMNPGSWRACQQHTYLHQRNLELCSVSDDLMESHQPKYIHLVIPGLTELVVHILAWLIGDEVR